MTTLIEGSEIKLKKYENCRIISKEYWPPYKCTYVIIYLHLF